MIPVPLLSAARMSLVATVFAALVLTGCSSFADRTKAAQSAIEESIIKLGYSASPSSPDTIEFKSTPRTMRGQTWMERQIRLLDHCDRDWTALTKFFGQEAGFRFEHILVIGESESDLQKIRWYEFKIDNIYTVYRVEFVREAALPGKRRGTPLSIQERTSAAPDGGMPITTPRTPRSP